MKPITIAVISIVAVAHPADAQQELEPVQNAFTYHTPDYLQKLQSVLFVKADGFSSEFQFLSLPSFEPETLLTVKLDDGEFHAYILRPNKQVWYHEGPVEKLKVIEGKKRIPVDLAKPARQLWHQMLLRTKFQRLNGGTLDGISYAFIASPPEFSQIAAESHNPEKGSKPELLARIGEQIIAYVEAKPTDEERILKQAKELIGQLEKALSEDERGGGKAIGEKTIEQGGARQPATALDSKSEGSKKPKPAPEGRSL